MSVTHVAQSTADGLWRPVLQKPADSEFFRSLLVLLCYKMNTSG